MTLPSILLRSSTKLTLKRLGFPLTRLGNTSYQVSLNSNHWKSFSSEAKNVPDLKDPLESIKSDELEEKVVDAEKQEKIIEPEEPVENIIGKILIFQKKVLFQSNDQTKKKVK